MTKLQEIKNKASQLLQAEGEWSAIEYLVANLKEENERLYLDAAQLQGLKNLLDQDKQMGLLTKEQFEKKLNKWKETIGLFIKELDLAI